MTKSIISMFVVVILFFLVAGFVIGTLVASKECNAAYRPYILELNEFRYNCQFPHCLPPARVEYNYSINILEIE